MQYNNKRMFNQVNWIKDYIYHIIHCIVNYNMNDIYDIDDIILVRKRHQRFRHGEHERR